MDDNKRPLYLPFAGPAILEAPLINKGSAFTEEERIFFNLEGLVPYVIETIEEQASRAYDQFKNFSNDLDKHIYLRNIQDTNETLFYRLVQNHITEMMPIIYTPTVGLACERFSKDYRRNRGLFISYPNKDRIDDILNNSTRHKVKVIVVTDGERILGLGDQGSAAWGSRLESCRSTPVAAASARLTLCPLPWMWEQITRICWKIPCIWVGATSA